jgi:hypothetical protein
MNFGASIWYRLRLIAAACALVVAAGLGNGQQAAAQEAGNAFKSFLTYFGMRQPNANDESIDYRARAPLAVPPRFDLPKPKESARDPSWPKDPDAAAQRRAALDAHTPVAQVPGNTGTPASAESQQGRGGLPADGPRDECEANSGMALCLSTPWKFLKSVGNVFHPGTVQPGPEPARKFLTDPPPGYQQPAVASKAAGEAPK